MKKNINSREDAVTKDMQPAEKRVRTYRFPTLGVEVQAKSYEEALLAAKKSVKNSL